MYIHFTGGKYVEVKELLLYGVALSMDALGVTLSLGINNKVSKKCVNRFIIFGGLFQFLFLLIGGLFGHLFEKNVATIPNLIGGVIIFLIGLIMFIDGIRNGDNEDSFDKRGIWLILAISVSIDALVIGFTILHNITSIFVLGVDSVFVGIITLFICAFGLFTCRLFKRIDFICKYADILGGVILIIFGIKMIFL